MTSQFEQLKAMGTVLVADTGDIESIRRLKPQDATTNPSLLFQAAEMPQFEHLVKDAVDYGRKNGGKNLSEKERLLLIADKLFVNFGAEITKIVPGYVSTEIDARLSFDTKATVERARRIIQLYKEVGIDKSRILVKVASTWEGMQACKLLEAEDIHCNMTLLFSFPQAVAAADANATLISPFVGRITDWYKKAQNVDNFAPEDDPGVKSVQRIYKYYKFNDIKTIVMGASFRNMDQILQLAGCDRLTLAPKYLEGLQQSNDTVQAKLTVEKSKKDGSEKRVSMDEKTFRWEMNQDMMATEKLAEGINNFSKDIVKLEEIINKKLNELSPPAKKQKSN